MKKLLLLFSFIFLFMTFGCEKELKCADGYTLEGTMCLKEIDHADAKEVSGCDDDFELKDNQCIKHEETEVKEKNGCDDGLTLTNDKCVGTLKKDKETTYKCTTGTVSGNKCITLTEKNDSLIQTAKCDSGWELKDNGCWQGTMPPLGCDWENGDYSGCFCESGDKLGTDSFCHKYKNVSYTYTCANGTTLKNDKCYQENSTNAESYKTCPTGYQEKNNECIKEVNTKANVIKYCDDDFELKDDKCIKETITDIKINYECDDGFEYKDNLCRKYEKEIAK